MTILKMFMANAIRLPIQRLQFDFLNIDSLESKKIAANNQILDSVVNENTLSPIIEPAILNQPEKQQNNRFYNFNQYQIPLKLQTTFATRIKVHKRNFLSKPSNY